MPAKRLLAGVLALLIAASFAAPSVTRAATAGGFTYDVVGGNATITGCDGGDGACPATIDIPSTLGGATVTAIGTRAFDGIPGITALTIPNTVTEIGSSAFEYAQITTLVIPDSVITIGSTAFYENALTSLTLGNSVTTIGGNAFAYSDLTTLVIPDSVTTISSTAFYDNSLTSLTLGNQVTTIGSSAFNYNNLAAVTIPNSVTQIAGSAFANNGLAALTLGNNVTTFGYGAFEHNLLVSVTIPASVTTYANYVFYDNRITSVTFEGNAPATNATLFGGNSGLTEVNRYFSATGWGATWSGLTVAVLPDPADTTSPETTLDTTPNSTTSSVVATFGFSGTDNRSSVTFECSVDGGTYASCTSPFSTSTLSAGSHIFAVRAVDAAGNIDPTPASYTWTIEDDSAGLPETNRDSSAWATLLAFVAALSAIAGVNLGLRGAKRA
jgi:hypothetical protein